MDVFIFSARNLTSVAQARVADAAPG